MVNRVIIDYVILYEKQFRIGRILRMLVSVIVPFYKGNEYMVNLFQMLDRNNRRLGIDCLEMIIVNDSVGVEVHVPDDSVSFDYRIICNKDNQGIQKSRVIGLEEAKGEYILFLDQDDKISDDCIRSQLDAICENDFVVGNGYSMEPDGKEIEIFPSLKRQNACLDKKYYYCFADPIRSVGQVMIKKDAIPKEWCTNILKNIGADDAYLWMKMLEEGKKGAINSNHIFSYTGKNVSGDYELMKASYLEVLDYLANSSNRFEVRVARHKTLLEHGGNSIWNKIRFIDAIIMRKLYYRLYWK